MGTHTSLQATPKAPSCQFSVYTSGVGETWIFSICGGFGPLPSYDMPGGRGTGKAHRVWSQMGFILLYMEGGEGGEVPPLRKISLAPLLNPPREPSCSEKAGSSAPSEEV